MEELVAAKRSFGAERGQRAPLAIVRGYARGARVSLSRTFASIPPRLHPETMAYASFSRRTAPARRSQPVLDAMVHYLTHTNAKHGRYSKQASIVIAHIRW